MRPTPDEVTRLLAEAGRGDREALEALLPVVYDELRSLAGERMRHERAGHTLQPTALVHEAYVRLIGQDESAWRDRTHFFGAAAEVMRRVLVDHARKKAAAKRGGERRAEPLDEALVFFEERSTDLIELDEAMNRLAALDPQQVRIVELRFFGGLTIDQAASLLDVSVSTVERGWRLARAWLLRDLSEH